MLGLLALSMCWSAMAGGLAAAPIADADASPAVVVIPASADFPGVITGSTNSQTIIMMNTGSTAVSFADAIVEGKGFRLSGITTPLILAPKSALTFNVEFIPDRPGTSVGSISLLLDSGDARILIPLSGTGEAPSYGLRAYPSHLIFGSARIGEMIGPQTVNLTNTGNSDVVITSIDMKSAGFSASGISLPLTLAPGQSASLDTTFLPETGGDAEGLLQVSSNMLPQVVAVSLFGMGKAVTRVLEAQPSSLVFRSGTAGTTNFQSLTLSNQGNSAVTITDVAVTDDSYSVSGLDVPVTLAPGENASFRVAYSPMQSAQDGGSLTIVSDASDSPTTISLTSSPVVPEQQSAVNLAWSPSSSEGVASYNVYRATISAGPYTVINQYPLSEPEFVDTGVESGGTYYYVTTAVDSNGNESSFSNEAAVTAP